MLQLLGQCQHTDLYCLWFLRRILMLCSSWGRKPVEVEFWGLERAGGGFCGIKQQESTGPGGGSAHVGTMVDSCHKAAVSVTDDCQDCAVEGPTPAPQQTWPGAGWASVSKDLP